MAPIPFTGEREEFDVDITEEEINSMKDSNGTIQFIMDVMRWCLPRFDNGETDLFTWQAQQIMSNYLRHVLTKQQLDITTNPLEKRCVP